MDRISMSFQTVLFGVGLVRDLHMRARDKEILYLTRDNFLDMLLDKNDRWSPNIIRIILKTPEAIDVLFLAVSMYLIEKEYTDSSNDRDPSAVATGQLPLMVGKRIHVNLSKFAEEDVKDFIVACVAIATSLGAHQFIANPITFLPGAGGLVSLAAKIKTKAVKLRKPLGEVCVVESVRGHYSPKTEKGASAGLVALELANEPCRYPGQECHYEVDKKCGITIEKIEQILQGLEKKEVIEHCNYEEPPQWKISP
jgi:hypothetical protein